mgnify:CR=1 FL=1
MKEIINKILKRKNIILEVIIIALIAMFSFSVAPKTLQNDTYYTVSIGNLIMENGIDMKDHFSWHEDLPYTYPHWLYDVFMSLIYNIGNWDGVYISVCVMSILLGLSIYIVNKKMNQNQFVSFAITIGAMYLLKDYIAARAQLVTFIIYVWVIFFIEKFIQNPKKIQYAIGIILSSILIANLHVAVWPFIFIISLPYIAEYIICLMSDIIIYRKVTIFIKKILLKKYKKNEEKTKIIQKQINNITAQNEKIKKVRETEEPYKIKMKLNKNVKWLILVMAICGLTGFLTPLGTTPYTYLIKTMNGNTVGNINEHLPLTLINNIPIMCTIVIILSLLIFTKVKIRLSDLFMIGGLTYLMFSSRRQSTMFVLLGSIILNRIIIEAIKTYSKEKMEMILRPMIGAITLLVMCLSIFYGLKFIDKKKDNSYVNENSYPVEAANWMLKNLNVNEIKLFNEYNYGSYLLYRGIPVFIDSRADLYAPEFNGKKDIFMDFINTSNLGTYYGKTFKEYGITHVILYKNSKIRMIIDETEPENYNKIYSDKNFVIYEVV